ncbi:hypothetical protein SEEM162_19004 [Salmonella enterica subsp. enterica serovar Senftenberg str. 316235162]|nr:hypothetical protein SEEM162_19004 [Salmonella enterica subsp. enterica serovar Senftenberg str. 316235162]
MLLRFIPLARGNTCNQMRGSKNGTVYPRWRGEHVGKNNLAAAKTGLSPLARGTRDAPADAFA